MLLLDTHVWVWWIHGDSRLSEAEIARLDATAASGSLYVSAISLWEVAKLVEKGRLQLPVPIGDWFDAALHAANVTVVRLSPALVADSTKLPEGFHSDPADQLIVATSRVHGWPLATADGKIRAYPHVDTVPMGDR